MLVVNFIPKPCPREPLELLLKSMERLKIDPQNSDDDSE
jgi:hypothetical protein